MDILINQTAAKSQAKTFCRRLTEMNSRYCGPLPIRTLTQGPYSVQYTGSWLYQGAGNDENKSTLLLCYSVWFRAGLFKAGLSQPRVSAKFDFILYESLRSKFSCILFACNWWWDALKRREKIIRENAFEQKKKKPGLKFNPRLAPIGLPTTGPWMISAVEVLCPMYAYMSQNTYM